MIHTPCRTFLDHTRFHEIFYSLLAGFLIVSISMFFSSLLMFTFPKNLRNKTTQVLPAPETKQNEAAKTDKKSASGSEKIPEIDEGSARPKLKDFVSTIKRQIKNDILMFRTASAVLHLVPITGLYVFLPKYLENQFHMATHNANFISGTFGILMMGVGIFVTGIISVKFPLSARKVSLWIAFTALATATGMLFLAMIGCPMDNFNGLQTITNELVIHCT
jgi:Organic Anion Transporter Polypeptide (OATP) family